MIFQKTDGYGGSGFDHHPEVLDNNGGGGGGTVARVAHLVGAGGGGGGAGGSGSIRFGELKRVKYVPKENNATEYNIFVIYTKESQNSNLRDKFELFLKSLLKYTTIPIHLHVITDEQSETSAEELIREQIAHYRKVVFYTLYDVKDCAEKTSDIVKNMLPLFNYKTGELEDRLGLILLPNDFEIQS